MKGKRHTIRDHCRTIRDLMTPTMRQAKSESVAVLVSAELFRRIYTEAKKGAR